MATSAHVRTIALGLPETEERTTWNQPTFRVQGKIFCWLTEDGAAAGVKVNKAERTELIAADPEKFFHTEHDTRYNVVQIRLDRIDQDELAELVRDAWQATAPARLRSSLEQ
ncbi:hypothetical protein SAMN05192558_110144 [Actinokineospora alba]|uniref:YjbR protein n=1 Tax=Actinokineospora alba TaxID=504798 RepID=A0A1H0TR21_9PSEU|nr:MmcQ/YjbR family DNA-binding protein [Actinokineospora alba]TDP70665.1 hypothetical protein C8E96_6293 [Actinokineospora alba]SDJ13127.1 hypothetical protein SAMN05421871_110144 [Actinokineospora alba]SDP56444.1 hypothetical protein SAMN05192558_110144 [Actinokineospora alba]